MEADGVPEGRHFTRAEIPAPHKLSAQSTQRSQQILDVGQLADTVDLGEGDLAVLIDDESSALADPLYGRAFAENAELAGDFGVRIEVGACLLYTSPSPRDRTRSRMPSSA